jgi:hypothetical protein
MSDTSYSKSFLTDKSPDEVFSAITDFRGWWSEEIEGNTDRPGETFFYHYKDVHLCKLKMTTSIPGEKLVYEVLDNHFSFTEDKEEWKGTKFIFEISEEEGKTKVNFTHKGLTPEHECFEICHESWDNYILKSLYNLIEKGKGKPNPKETDGFNADIVKKWNLGS